MAEQDFEVSEKFFRNIKRGFVISSRDWNNYTDVQLNEEIRFALNAIEINEIVWYVAKNITSYLGISINNSTRILKTLDQANIRDEYVKMHQNNRSIKMKLINKNGIDELLEKHKTEYTEQVKNWLYQDVFQDLLNVQFDQQLEKKENYRPGGGFDIVISIMNDMKLQHQKDMDKLMIQNEQCQKNMVELKVQNEQHQKDMDKLMLQNEQCQKNIVNLTLQVERYQAVIFELKKIATIPAVDTDHKEVFIIMETGETNFESKDKNKWKFPYRIIRCQLQNRIDCMVKCRKKYENAKKIFEIEQPNNQRLLDALKRIAKQANIHVEFYRVSFYLQQDSTIAELIELIHQIENERANL